MEVSIRTVTVFLDATFLTLDLVRRADAGIVDSDQIIFLEHSSLLKGLSASKSGKIIFFKRAAICGGPHRQGVSAAVCRREPDSTPNSDLKFSVGSGLLSKRIISSQLSSYLIFKLNIPSPVIRQLYCVMARETTGSGLLSKHSRTSLSIPGIDRCLRNEFCVILPFDVVFPEDKPNL